MATKSGANREREVSSASTGKRNDPNLMNTIMEEISQLAINNAMPIETPVAWRAARKKSLSDNLRRRSIWQACETGMSFDVKWYLNESKCPDALTHCRDLNGNTALIAASSANHIHGGCTQIIRDLLKAGADINARNKRGRIALMEASL
jgi:ankyrin repeat protein